MKITKIKSNPILEDVNSFKKDQKTDTGLILGTRDPKELGDEKATPVIDHNLAKAKKEDELNRKEREDAEKAHDKEIKELVKEQEKEPKIKTDKKTGLFVEKLKESYKGNFIVKEGFCGIRLKDRKELAGLIESLKDYKVHLKIRRAVTEGFKYFATFNMKKVLKEDLELPAVAVTGPIDSTDVQPQVDVKEEEINENAAINGVISMFNDAITDEYRTIDKYTSIITTLLTISEIPEYIKERLVESAKDIISEEHIHVGQFQQMSALLKPQTEQDIEKGKEEVKGTAPVEEPVK